LFGTVGWYLQKQAADKICTASVMDVTQTSSIEEIRDKLKNKRLGERVFVELAGVTWSPDPVISSSWDGDGNEVEVVVQQVSQYELVKEHDWKEDNDPDGKPTGHGEWVASEREILRTSVQHGKELYLLSTYPNGPFVGAETAKHHVKIDKSCYALDAFLEKRNEDFRPLPAQNVNVNINTGSKSAGGRPQRPADERIATRSIERVVPTQRDIYALGEVSMDSRGGITFQRPSRPDARPFLFQYGNECEVRGKVLSSAASAQAVSNVFYGIGGILVVGGVGMLAQGFEKIKK